ncbi:MAG: 30S ribosomal protein S16 [Firmicutes bacterium]|nr:30S ribosomal protein S16 [Bacillota bacterium]
MTKIRLTRLGDKGSPFYRVVVVDSREKRDGAVIEQIGTYNPLLNPAEIKIDAERAKYWLGVGAQPTDTARDLLIKGGAMPAPAKRPPAKTPKKKEKK